MINLDPIPMSNVAGYVGWDTVSNQVIEDRQVVIIWTRSGVRVVNVSVRRFESSATGSC